MLPANHGSENLHHAPRNISPTNEVLGEENGEGGQDYEEEGGEEEEENADINFGANNAEEVVVEEAVAVMEAVAVVLQSTMRMRTQEQDHKSDQIMREEMQRQLRATTQPSTLKIK